MRGGDCECEAQAGRLPAPGTRLSPASPGGALGPGVCLTRTCPSGHEDRWVSTRSTTCLVPPLPFSSSLPPSHASPLLLCLPHPHPPPLRHLSSASCGDLWPWVGQLFPLANLLPYPRNLLGCRCPEVPDFQLSGRGCKSLSHHAAGVVSKAWTHQKKFRM